MFQPLLGEGLIHKKSYPLGLHQLLLGPLLVDRACDTVQHGRDGR